MKNERTPGTIFTREDFDGTLKQLAEQFRVMFAAGQVKIVIRQDWRVDRLAPPFIDVKHIASLLREGDIVLHIGQGDSSACRYFNEVGVKHTSDCFADAVYLDPHTIIGSVLTQEPMFCGRQADAERLTTMRRRIAEILRDEFLVPASMFEMANADLGIIEDFSPKDFEIMQIKARHYRADPPTEPTDEARVIADSRATYRALLEILERQMKILIPNTVSGRRYRRSISRLGRRLIQTQLPETDDQRLAMLASNLDYLQPKPMHDVLHAAMTAFREVCLQPNQMILGDFRTTALPKERRYNLIEGCRSDAFLGETWAEFLELIIEHLADDGMYFSDGILSAYSYQFYLEQFVHFLRKKKGKFKTWIVVPPEQAVADFYPPTYIAGVVVARSDFRPDILRDSLTSRGFTMVPVATKQDILAIPEARHQLAWTAFFRLVLDQTHDVEALPHQHVVTRLRSIPFENGQPKPEALLALFNDLAI